MVSITPRPHPPNLPIVYIRTDNKIQRVRTTPNSGAANGGALLDALKFMFGIEAR